MAAHTCDICGAAGTVWMHTLSSVDVYYCERCCDDYLLDNDGDDEPSTCPHCNGTGIDSWTGFEECEYCDGMGYKWWE